VLCIGTVAIVSAVIRLWTCDDRWGCMWCHDPACLSPQCSHVCQPSTRSHLPACLTDSPLDTPDIALSATKHYLLHWIIFFLIAVYRCCMIVSGTLKYDEPEVENVAWECRPSVTFQPRVIIFQCCTNNRASYVLSYGQPLA